MPIIYRKTAKGMAEIETRIYRLSPRLRGTLIVVDGRRSDTEVAQMMPQVAESLAALLEGGFIEELAQLAPPAPPAPSPRAPRASDARFEAMRRDLLRALYDRVGPAGDSLTLRLERAPSEEEFRALLPQAVQIVGMVHGRDAAEAFAARIEAW